MIDKQIEPEKLQILECRTRNCELEQQLQARTIALEVKVNRERLMASLSMQIRSSLSIEVILDYAMAQVRQLLDCDRVNIWKLDENKKCFVVAESTNSSPSVVGEQVDISSFGQSLQDICRKGWVRIVNDVHETEMSDYHRDLNIRHRVRAKILMPISCCNNLWGFVNATESRHARHWQPEEVELLQALSVHLGIAIQHATAHQQLQEKLSQCQLIEKQLRKSESRNRAILGAVPDVMVCVSADGIIREWICDKDFSLIDKNIDLILSPMTIADIFPVDVAQRQLDHLQKAIQIGELQVFEQQIQLDDRILDEEVRIIKSSENEALFMIRDISDRKSIERKINQLNQELESEVEKQTKQLKAHELELQQLSEITQRIRQSLDLQTIFDTACLEIRQLMQCDRVAIYHFDPESNHSVGTFVAEAVADGFRSAMVAKVRDYCFSNHASVYAQGKIYAVNDIDQAGLSECHRNILTQFQVKANLVIPLLCGNDLWGLLCIHQCTAPRQWQDDEIELAQQVSTQLAIAIKQATLFEQLNRSNRELARATRLKDEFLANMSHELRTPLNAISGLTEGLKEGFFGAVNEEQIGALKIIESSGTHLLSLIDDILNLAKIEADNFELHRTLASANSLCESSLVFIKQQALQKQIQLDLKLESDFPLLFVDERRMRQVLINLLSNAVKFTPLGGTITLKASQVKSEDGIDYLQFAVIDNGIGIAPENIHKLFQTFVQIDSALNRQYSGTGLGLVLVKRIVEFHNGFLEVTSELGVGSCFSVNLPLADNLPEMASEIIVENSLDENETLIPDYITQNNNKSHLILLVEDNDINIAMITNFFTVYGYRYIFAEDGQEAIALAKSQQPDLILMDIQIPKINGLEAIAQIRQCSDSKHIPIIAITALAMTGDRERCLQAGADEYISKPVKLKQLAAQIQHLLSKKELYP